MTSQSEKDVIAECCEPHHPFKVSNILKKKGLNERKLNLNYKWTFKCLYSLLETCHFPAKIVPSWLHTLFECLPVDILWKSVKGQFYETHWTQYVDMDYIVKYELFHTIYHLYHLWRALLLEYVANKTTQFHLVWFCCILL